MIMNGCVQWNPVYGREEGQRLTYLATARFFLKKVLEKYADAT